MKAEEILNREILNCTDPDNFIAHHTKPGVKYIRMDIVLKAMNEFAHQFQSPQISEEEIRAAACERISREKTFAIQRQVAFIQGARWALSRLPHEQPVGKTDTLEVEQQGEEPLDIDEHIVK